MAVGQLERGDPARPQPLAEPGVKPARWPAQPATGPEDPEHRGVARLRRLQAAVDRAGLRQQAQALLARRFILSFDAA